jgi:hypothetical protein
LLQETTNDPRFREAWKLAQPESFAPKG